MIWPESTLLSLYNAFPRRTGRAVAIPGIAEALDRICAGEIDGKPRSQEEAVVYLREKVDAAREALCMREKRFMPHPSTWFHQSRYLRTEKPVEMPKRLDVCVTILAMYPKMSSRQHIERNLRTFLPALNAIERCVEAGGAHFVQYLAERTALYAFHVSSWPASDLQYVPGPQRWFSERRFEQDEQQWIRTNAIGWEDERNQILRLVASGTDGGRGTDDDPRVVPSRTQPKA